MNANTNPASFHQPTTDAAAKAHHRKDQSPRGEIGCIILGANGGQVSNYSDPQGTVFIDRESYDGAWVKFLNDTGHGDCNAE